MLPGEMKPLHTWRLWCEPKRKHWFVAYVFATKRQMYGFHDLRHGRGQHNYEARVQGLIVYSDGKRTGKLGEMFLYAGNLGAGIVAHECTHAALRWLDDGLHRLKWPSIFSAAGPSASPAEERFCWVVGNLVLQFWRRFYRCHKTATPKGN